MTDILARQETITTPYRPDRVNISKRAIIVVAAAVTVAVAAALVTFALSNEGSTSSSGATVDAAQLRWEGLAADHTRPTQALVAEQLRWEGLGSADYAPPVAAAAQLRWSGLADYHLGARSRDAISAETQRWSAQALALDGSLRARQTETSRWEAIARAHDPS